MICSILLCPGTTIGNIAASCRGDQCKWMQGMFFNRLVLLVTKREERCHKRCTAKGALTGGIPAAAAYTKSQELDLDCVSQ